MLGKVIKHDLRASSPLYGVACAIALFFALAAVLNRSGNDDFSYLRTAPFLITGCTVAILVLVILFLIHTALRYQRSMYGDEGYLTFSLPVRTAELVAGKFLAASLWGIIICLLCGVLCFSILYGAVSPSETERFWEEAHKLWSMAELRNILLVVSCSMLVSMLEQIAMIYLAVTLGHLPCFRRANGILTLVFYFGITFAEGKITDFIPMLSSEALENSLAPLIEMGDLIGFSLGLQNFLQPAILLSLAFTAVFLVISGVLVKKYISLQ